MKNLDYYRAVLLGAVIAAFFLSMFYVFNKEDKPPKPQSNFEVVDTYKGCDLVRRSNRGLSDYKYVLYCPK